MIGRTNVGGGGSGNAFAYIGVTYPAGATLTCTDGTRTLRAKDTTGLYVFPVPYAGTWTVTATDGTNTDSERVSITRLWQDAVVSLVFFDGTIFDHGNLYSAVTGGWIVNNDAVINPSYSPGGWASIPSEEYPAEYMEIGLTTSRSYNTVQPVNKIDLTGLQSVTISFTGTLSDGSTPYVAFTIANNNSGRLDAVSGGVCPTNYPTYDVSSISFNGSYYILIYIDNGSTARQNTVQITKVKLNY